MVDQATIAGGLQTLSSGLAAEVTKTTPVPATGLTATGTTRADALPLTGTVNDITGAATGTGVVLPTTVQGGPGNDVVVFNDAANPIKVYAPGSITIDGVAGATGVTLTNAKRALFYLLSPTAYISAQLGVPSA